MIDARELRIGNLVGEHKPHKVSAIYLSHFTATDENGIQQNSAQYNLNPIPLNPEILEKCGFKSVHGFTYLNHEKLNLASFQYDEVKNCIWLEFEGTICGIEIYYLHQLQNLYYSLTNSELNITL